MDQKYILSILAVLVGATFGWALKGLTELWQIRRADRKVLKSILYHFLETYRLLKKLNADNLQTGLQKLYAKIPGLSTLANSPEFISYFSSLIFDKQVKFINEDFNTIKVDLASSISTLKTIDPFLALDLQYSATIKKTLDNVETMLTELEINMKKDFTVERLVPSIVGIMTPIFIDRSLGGIKNDVLKVACKLGPKTWWRARGKIAKMSALFTDEEIEEGAVILQQIIVKFEKANGRR